MLTMVGLGNSLGGGGGGLTMVYLTVGEYGTLEGKCWWSERRGIVFN